MLKVGSELRSKVEQLKSKQMEANECSWRELRTNATNRDMPELNFGGGKYINVFFIPFIFGDGQVGVLFFSVLSSLQICEKPCIF